MSRLRAGLAAVGAVAARMSAGHPPVGATPARVVHRENKWRLLRYARDSTSEAVRHPTPVLLVPSLINRHYVLDLLPGRSLVEFLIQAGHDVFLIDWGTPGPEDRYVSFDTICDRYLGRAVRTALNVAGASQVHLLGYCMGGTLAAIYTAVHTEQIASLTALASPIDFHDTGLLSVWTRTQAFDVDALVDAFGNVPWPMMQASFQLLRPTMAITKVRQLLERAEDDVFMDTFWAIETWGADAVSFPGECYRRYIKALYRENALVEGTFTLSGRPVRLEDIRCPTMAVSFEQDHIVPWKSCAALLEHVGAEVRHDLHLRGGHVGAVISKRAATSLWPALSEFWVHGRPSAGAGRRPSFEA